MADVCPRCGESDQVHDLADLWRSLSSDAENSKLLGPPAKAEVNYLYAVGVAALGVALLATGAVVPGLLVLVGGVAWGAAMSRKAARAQAAIAEWERSKRCVRCPVTFVPKEA